MSKETDSLFEAIFALEDIREVLRETAPKHCLTDQQKDRVNKALQTVEHAMKELKDALC